MPLAVNDIVQVSYRGTCLGQRIMLVTSWRVTATASINSVATDLQSVVSRFNQNLAGDPRPTYLACMGQNYTLNEVRAQRIYPTRSRFETATPSVIGTIAEDVTAVNVAGVVTRVTADAGRSQVANSHLGPPPPTRYSQGAVTIGYATVMSAWAATWNANLFTTIPVIDLAPTIFHRASVTPKWSDIIGSRVQTTLRTMRRRTVGLGE